MSEVSGLTGQLETTGHVTNEELGEALAEALVSTEGELCDELSHDERPISSTADVIQMQNVTNRVR
jgi:hypothetical protein